MLPRVVRHLRRCLPLALLTCALGCSVSGERPAGTPMRAPLPGPPFASAFSAPDDRVRSVQLYRVPEETALPILTLGSPVTLLLEFDLLGTNGRALSIEFYHADREWNLEAYTGTHFRGFNTDTVMEYHFSHGVDLPYLHYVYPFPNPRIEFETSGNYVLRVTELDAPEKILLERPFLVEEDGGVIAIEMESELVAGQSIPLGLPAVSFHPPPGASGSAFDYDLCVFFHGQLGWGECSGVTPVQRGTRFEFPTTTRIGVDPEQPLHYLDLRDWEENRRIVGIDRERVPTRIALEPDPSPRLSVSREYLNGQPQIRSDAYFLSDPNTQAEYAMVRFSLVPVEQRPIGRPIYLVGSFTGWLLDEANELVWRPEARAYTADVLLKQGQYEYNYVTTDRDLRFHLYDRAAPELGLLTVMIYYDDPELGISRLVATKTTRLRL